VTLEAGAQLGRYRIESLVGRGGMGAVYLATDTQLERRVALKVLSPELTDDARFRDRFITESRIAASLDHPNIVPVYEAGEIDGQLFIAMRYIDGHDLSHVLVERGALPITLAVRIVAAVAAALDAAHAGGLVHRDVKPGNVLLAGSDEAPHVYLTDFGLTKRVGDATMTAAGQIVGSIGYVAPEQVEGRPVDARTDVYSLGCLAYEILAGAQPFRRESEMAVLMAHVQDPPPSLLAERPELPEALDAAIARAMAKDPAARFATAGEFAAALSEAVRPDSGATTRGFLFSDLRGYTAFVESHGDAAASALLDVYRRMMRDTIARHGGAEIKTEGDSFYVVFPSASSAVICGLSVVAAAAAHSQADPQHPIRVGIGVNAGEAVAAAEGYVGSAVNIAARVCAQAKAGEVLVTETVRGLTRTSGRLNFTPVGRRTLKGIAEPMPLFHADLAGTGPLVAPGASRPVWRRAPVLAGTGGMVALILVLATVLAKGGLGPGASLPALTPAGLVAAALTPLPDIGRIAFVRGPADKANGFSACSEPSEGTNVWVVRDDGTGAARLTDQLDAVDQYPNLSPDGNVIAYRVGSAFADPATTKLATVPAAGGSNTTLGSIAGAGSSASWSPDGRRFAYIGVTKIAGGTYPAAFVADADGSNSTRIWAPTVPTALAKPAIILVDTKPDPGSSSPPGPTQQIMFLDWMATGSIAMLLDPVVQSESPRPSVVERQRIDVIHPDGTALAPLMPALDIGMSSFDVSPDGRTVAFNDNTADDKADVYTVGIDGSGLKRLTDDSGSDQDPVWSPDGTKLAFSSDRGGFPEIYVMGSDGSQPRRITQSPAGRGSCEPSWRHSVSPIATAARTPDGTPADPFQLELGQMAAGTYSTAPFNPPFQVTVPDRWYMFEVTPDSLAFRRTPTGSRTPTDIWFSVSQVQVVTDGHCLDSPTKIIGPTPLDFVSWLKTNADLKVGAVDPISAGGAAGVHVRVSVRKLSTASCLPFMRNQTAVFPVSNDEFSMRLDEVDDFLVLDVHGKRLVVALGGPKAELGPIQVETQAILDSIRFP
jgi:serine/threonine-protein kinase